MPQSPAAIVAQAADERIMASAIIADLRDAHDSQRRSVDKFRAAGLKLLDAKRTLPHGRWTPFVERLNISERQAQRYMKLAQTDPASDLVAEWSRICGHQTFTESSVESETPPTPEHPKTDANQSTQATDSAPSTNQTVVVPPGAGDAWEPNSGNPGKPDPAQAEGEPEPTDALGNAIPKKLRDVFVGNSEAIDQARKGVFAARKVAKEFGSWNSWARFDEMEKALSTLATDFKKARPYAVCEACKGNGCKDCRNIGWLTEWAYKDLHHD